MKNWISIIVIFSSLQACRVGPEYERNGIAANKKEYASLDSSKQSATKIDSLKLEKWFDLYKDDALRQLIKAAMENNPDMRLVAARVEEARANAGAVRASLLPTLGYDIGAGFNRNGTNPEAALVSRERDYFNGAAILSWEIDLFGKIRNNRNSFINTYLQQEALQRNLMVSLVAEVADNYFLLRDLDNRLVIAKRTVESRKESLRINTERFNKGYTAEIDKLQSEIQLASVEAVVPLLKRQIQQVENQLNLLTGRNGGSINRGLLNKEQTLPPEIPAGIPSQLLERRPDIQAAEFALKAQYDRIGIAQANRFPTLNLTAVLGMASPQLTTLVNGQSPYTAVAGGLTGPIFAFNQNKRRVDAERQKAEQFQATYDKTVLQALLDVDFALANNNTLSEEYNARKRQVAAAEKAYKLSRQRYDFGYTSYLEVLTQENFLFDAEIQESITLRQKHSAIVTLYKALGGGW